MKNTTTIIRAYTTGEATLEETNKALKEAGSTLYLNPDKNVLTEEELAATVIGETPAEVNGWGLLDSGTATMDKVKVENGRIVSGGMGVAEGLCIIGGKVYKVADDILVEG